MDKRFVFSNSNEMQMVPHSAMVYIASSGNYSTITLADGSDILITQQLGQVEYELNKTIGYDDAAEFVRIGRKLILNCQYVLAINVAKQKIVMSDARTFRHELTASKEALRQLKDYLTTIYNNDDSAKA